LGNSSNRFIDAAGRLLSVTNPRGNLTRYDYDGLNRLKKVTDPLGGMTQFDYDPNGNLLSLSDAKSNPTIYTYDNMDRLETRKDPLLQLESYQYNENGNLIEFTDRKGQVTTFQYDALNRRTFAGFGTIAGNPPVYESTITYTYDAGNRLRQIVDSISGTITRDFDDLDRLKLETTPQGSVAYDYDDAGRRKNMTVSGQPIVVYTYDDINRLKRITQGAAIVLFDYDDAGRRRSLTLPNDILVEYDYDDASRVKDITYKLGTTVLGNLTYTYDAAGNRTKIGGSFARTGVPQAIASATYNAANQQLALGDKTMTYDLNGNLDSITDSSSTTNYTWDARNKLTDISGANMTASFVYDGLGRRERKTIGGTTTEFLYDGINPLQETNGVAVLANMLTGLGIDEYLARTGVAAGTTDTFLTDSLGSTVALTDSSGTIQTQYTYEPFGKTTSSGVVSTNSFQYTGRENDGTGLYYYRARYYHPQLQRFSSEDPIRFSGGEFNLYAYVVNNPLRYIDPFGLDKDPNDPYNPNNPNNPDLTDLDKLIRDLRRYEGIAKAVAKFYENLPLALIPTHILLDFQFTGVPADNGI